MPMCDRPSGLFEWAFDPRNPIKNRAFVGQPILAAAVFQAAFLQTARESRGNRPRFFDLVARRRARRHGGGVSCPMNDDVQTARGFPETLGGQIVNLRPVGGALSQAPCR
jgi:hypothetical protein